jgi:hypothetical protein
VWRPLACVLPFVMALVACKGRVEGQPASSAPPAPVQETKVLGTPPDLAGRWLSLGWLELPDGRTVSAPMLWEIAVRDGKPVMTHQFVSLPPALKAAADKANADGKPWEPSPGELEQLRAGWDALHPEDQHVARMTNEIAGRDGFDDSVKGEARSKDALWLVRQRMDFDASAAPVVRQVMIYSVLASSDREYTGNFDMATVAAAPFPIPISYKGTFRLYRVDAPPAPRGFLSRLFDGFAGCGRRAHSS